MSKQKEIAMQLWSDIYKEHEPMKGEEFVSAYYADKAVEAFNKTFPKEDKNDA